MNMKNPNTAYHIPALLEESVDLLKIQPNGTYVDATFGGGGHSRAILERLGADGRLFSFDRDLDALANSPEDPRFIFVHGDFRYIKNWLMFYKVEKVNGILADLGVSFHHFDIPERGFSFRTEAPLDMRMNQQGDKTARAIIKNLDEAQLANLFRKHTDIPNSHAIAKAICIAKRDKDIDTTVQLTEIVSPLLNKKAYKKELAQVFQALRIATNDEISSLEKLLESSLSVLKPGGRMVVLTYHSGEDKIVKNFFKTGSFNEVPDVHRMIYGTKKSPWKILTSSPIMASDEEVNRNPRSRSAKLRAAELR